MRFYRDHCGIVGFFAVFVGVGKIVVQWGCYYNLFIKNDQLVFSERRCLPI